MKKKILIPIIILVSILLIFGGIKLYSYLRIKYAKVEVDLVSDLTLEFNDKKKVSDYIESINGKIINDYTIDSSKLGKKTIDFKFINDDNIKLDYSFDVNVVDTVPPVVWLSNTYTLKKGSEDTLLDDILCGDNYDNSPKCEIIGDYDLNTEGNYSLKFKATDSSNNITEKDFTLKVYEPVQTKSDNSTKTKEEIKYVNFSDVVNKYKDNNTKIGIDISLWQGDIDFKKLKEAGVEFVIIRAGYMKGTNGERVLDSKFKQNIENANKNKIPVGVYYFSYASSKKEAIKDAKWVLKQIKKYDVTLPVAFDWEDFRDYNSYKLSFYNLTSMADGFIEEVEKNGYKGMLYGSKNYLEQIWLPNNHNIWLAHYTDKTSYEGNYKFWQLTEIGKVDGIDGTVDIDIYYEK